MYNGSHTDNTLSSYGSYYNGRVANTLTASETVSAQTYTSNVCAKNWTLPTSSQLTTVTNYASTFNIVYAGYYKSSALSGGGSYADWWSRTGASSTYFHVMNGHSGTLKVYYNSSLSNATISSGWSIRCVIK